MLAQLKTVVLIKEAIQLAFFRLVEYIEHQHLWVQIQAQNGQKQIISSETSSEILILRNESYSMREIAKKLKILYNAVYYSLHITAQTGSNQNRERSGRPRCTTEQEDKYIRGSSLRNRRLTSPQLAASLNSTRKTPVSTSTVKRHL
jgi:transposase